MALQSQGSISLNDIATEFGGSTPHSLSEYYGAADGIPSSGSISFSQFYGKSSVITITISNSGGNMFNTGVNHINTGSNFTSTSYTFSPGIPISSNITFTYNHPDAENVQQAVINPGQPNSVSSSYSRQGYTLNFSGTMTALQVNHGTTLDEGCVHTFAVGAIDGSTNWTYINSSTITIP